MNFKVHNGARDTATRTQRAERPTHGGLKQFIMNGERRLVRGRPIQITFEQLERYIEEFRTKEKEGVLYVTTMDDRVVNLYDDRLPAAPAAPVQNPRPNAPLDSAANDTPTGHNMNQFPRETAPPKDFTMPVEPPVASVENNPAAPPAPPAPVEPPAPPADPAPDLLELADLGEETAPVTPQAPIGGSEPSDLTEVLGAQQDAAEEAAAGTEVVVPPTTPETDAIEGMEPTDNRDEQTVADAEAKVEGSKSSSKKGSSKKNR